MNYTTQAILSLAIIFIFTWNRWTNYYAPKWYALSVLIALMISHQVFIVSNNYVLAITYAYVLINSLWGSFSQMNKIQLLVDGKPFIQTIVEFCRTNIAILLIGCLFIFGTKFLIDTMYFTLPFIIVGSALHVYIPIKYRTYKNMQGIPMEMRGAGANVSVDCSLTSVMTILVLCSDMNPYIRYGCLVVGFASIFKTKASSGLFGLAIGSSIYFVATFGLYAIVSILPIAIIAVWLYGDKLFALSGRAKIWKQSILLTHEHKKLIFGFGAGSYKTVHSRIFPHRIDTRILGFIWGHNFIVQTLFEYGSIGLLLAIASIVSIAINCSWVEIAVIACCVVNMTANFINHLAPEVMMMTLFIKKHYLIN